MTEKLYCPECVKRMTSPPQRQLFVIDSDEKASAHMEKALWDFIDTASMFPLAKPDPRTWPHVMVFAPQRQPLKPQSPCEMTQAEYKMFKLGWLECEAAHGIKENT